ncbi:hypothetical protein BO83DRAFT_396627 [Aspergillus eucalypticola CBS 122712]|uniref:Uncharacterized protein n=1 Tax=Aspergillus eucalypticola (strain CBS 122712 / IBT 29274) TaxID=1448314 RepID=A0A317W5B1_ASPEC|nr:uncharacterized protein BO83DRAFT_396627 [Aspergillus eucalypticola CBS 122712]PWY80238.1 hypothetical protein BO83DRAFT_396627 [Aspergillus eucalypticola CBS 122712]
MSNTEEKAKFNILYSAPGFAVLDPDTIKTMANPSNTIFGWGGVQIVKISPEVVVKFDSHVTLHEAKSMVFVDQNTIFAYYSYGSVVRGPLPDPVLGDLKFKGECAIINAYQDRAPKRHVKNVLVSMLSPQNRHYVVFAHGFSGNVTGIKDWEFSGWYPEHWESVKALAKLHAIVPSHCDHLPIGPSESISKRPARIAPVAPPLLLPPMPSRALSQPLLGATSSSLSANDSPELLPVAVMSLAARLPGLSTQPICFLQSFARSPVVV